MSEYIKLDEEKTIRKLLDDLADNFGLDSPKREKRFPGYYLDRLWYKIIEGEKLPLIAFEIERGVPSIERGVPSNERIRKDIMNLACTRAPKGYIILPHKRILNDPEIKQGSNWASWYKSNFEQAFLTYNQPFSAYCDIKIVDADALLTSHSLVKSVIKMEPKT